jgi:farnesyl diphosphate synthase
MDAINDALIIETFQNWLLRTYVQDRDTRYFVLDLFAETARKTQIGQMTDLLSQPQGKTGVEVLNTFNISVYKRIVKYKTAFYTFYLPMALGYALAGVTDSATLKAVEGVCVEIGEKFQIQDDYLDCYGAPELIGKIGTDIQDHKCCWLVVQALERVTPEQRAVLEANYGKHDDESVARVKALYNELDMPSIYAAQEEASLQRINDKLAAHKDLLEPKLFADIIKRVHGRQK